MSLISASIIACLLLQSPVNCKDPSVEKLVRDATVIAVAEIEEVKQSVGIWSGLFLVIQRVDYKVKAVLKGETPGDRISVGHYIVARSSTADDQEPRLSPTLFVPGKTVVLFLTADPGKGYLSASEDNGRGNQRFLALDSKCGLVSGDEVTINNIKHFISGSP